MNFDQRSNNIVDNEPLPNGLTPADIIALSHYPSLDKLFHEADLSALTTMTDKLEQTFQNIERVVLRASAEESKKAKLAAGAVKNALNFLQMLRQARSDKTNS